MCYTKNIYLAIIVIIFLSNMNQSRPFFVYFRPFIIQITILTIQIEKSINGVLEIWTRGRRMVGADKPTELCGYGHNLS